MKKNILSRWAPALVAVAAVVAFMAGSLAHMAGAAPHAAEGLSDAEARMLAQVAALTHAGGGKADGRYDVVMAETIAVPTWADDPGMAYDAKDFIVSGFRKTGADAGALLDRLYQANAKSVHLALPAAQQAGYIVDDGSYAKYFEFGGGGWKRLRQEHSQAANLVRYSRPVYDEATGLFLVYVRADAMEGGRGAFVLYRNENGALKLVDIERLWGAPLGELGAAA